ncbi:hypothetical protein RB195_021833 [Necator americanus]|uniref:Uncharacterized protein n=1 Tax=Necator americanus TaxID=51031 RepID=A0ABR1ED48_NECAM
MEGASLLFSISGATQTTCAPLTSRLNDYQGSEEGDDSETSARIKVNNNLGSAQTKWCKIQLYNTKIQGRSNLGLKSLLKIVNFETIFRLTPSQDIISTALDNSL